MLTNKDKNTIKREIMKAMVDHKNGLFFKFRETDKDYIPVYTKITSSMIAEKIIEGLNKAQKKINSKGTII